MFSFAPMYLNLATVPSDLYTLVELQEMIFASAQVVLNAADAYY